MDTLSPPDVGRVASQDNFIILLTTLTRTLRSGLFIVTTAQFVSAAVQRGFAKANHLEISVVKEGNKRASE